MQLLQINLSHNCFVHSARENITLDQNMKTTILHMRPLLRQGLYRELSSL